MVERKSKYDENNYCSRHKWIKKENCIVITLPSGLIQYRCPHCRRPCRTVSRIAKFRKEYVRTCIEIDEEKGE